jgi:hypothetical protein
VLVADLSVGKGTGIGGNSNFASKFSEKLLESNWVGEEG